jgi:hypothetical protein
MYKGMKENQDKYNKYLKPYLKRLRKEGWKSFYLFAPAPIIEQVKREYAALRLKHKELWEREPTTPIRIKGENK